MTKLITTAEIEKIKELAGKSLPPENADQKWAVDSFFDRYAFMKNANPEFLLRLIETLERAEELLSTLCGAASDCLINDRQEREEALESIQEDIENTRAYFAEKNKGDEK